ncbi:hypothetical protein FGG08_006281 [Glutinoglossum americanum]|uniref:Mitotic checkpoint regulator, MAD2B-interacting-domain-containing protein n=1 Tax=Glutinoglossum americanum TaxID=1670608 RepID=A0A9P8I3S2_9PEZI|nr:hypothetical protein FGG08_006281 [Glutinoglossum americanum]
MGLVDYSDSENSDSDTVPEPKPNVYISKASEQKPESKLEKTITAPVKPAFQKVVDRSNPRKILVSLPKSTEQDGLGGEQSADGPPAKRPRLGGGAFSGFNALLPAPKRTGLTIGGGLSGSAAGKGGLGRGVSLKTGATPGFVREKVSESFDEDADGGLGSGFDLKDGYDTTPTHQGPSTNSSEPKIPQTDQSISEPKKTGSAMMFKPLSVARKPPKKKPPIANTTDTASQAPQPPTLPQKKPSLFSFSTGDQDPPPTTSTPSHSNYKPLVYQPTASPPPQDPPSQPQPPSASLSDPSPSTLDEIATSLNLSSSAKRQLFGRQRGGKNTNNPSTPITIKNFNTDAEYAANEQLRAAGETVQHNPVRAIAPGKHSLKQLVTAASNQKEALEEHFATGKRNKREAGSRYGW